MPLVWYLITVISFMLTPIFSWQMVKEIAIHVKVQHTEKDKLRLGIVIAALHAVEGTDP